MLTKIDAGLNGLIKIVSFWEVIHRKENLCPMKKCSDLFFQMFRVRAEVFMVFSKASNLSHVLNLN